MESSANAVGAALGGYGLPNALELIITSSSRPAVAPLYDTAAAAMAARFGEAPEWAVVLGSGLGTLLEQLTDAQTASHADLGLPSPGVAGHAGVHAVGKLGGARVLLVSGRLHLYEGHPADTVVAGIRAMARWGVKKVLLTNAAGSCRPDWAPGTLMRLTDHINLAWANPLIGPNDDSLGPRFPDLARAYDPQLGQLADDLASQLGVSLQKGVYAAMRGPSYETAAEVVMLGRLGADVVGMSTVPEVIAAVHAGLRVAAFSVVSNYGTGLTDEIADHASVTRMVGKSTAPLIRLVTRIVASC